MKRSPVESNRVELRDASLPGYELGYRAIELSRVGSFRILAGKELGSEKRLQM
jgi:hypothetical protein